MDAFNGIRIMVNPLAETRRRVAVIERTRVTKRRRSWVLRYEMEVKPAAYRLANGVMVVHPTIHQQMLEQLALEDNPA